MSIALKQILDLVGKLDDTPGEETPRERFRRFLKENIKEVGQIRDYIEECLRNSGDQYNRALQDLVNYLGHFLGFEVTFGRYHGIQGKIGFDGLWKSPTRFFIVVEVKTTDIYAIKTATLIGYVDALISEKEISDWDHALGLYVIGRPDAELRQLENAILAEKRTHQLRIISVESLLSLAELFNEYDVSHEDILAVLRPSGTTVDPVVDLMARLVAQRQVEEETKEETTEKEEITEAERQYWLTPVKSEEEQTAEDCIQSLVGEEKIYAFGERTPGRRHLKQGDYICFYSTGKGVIAHAQIASRPERKEHPKVRHTERYPWVFRVKDVHLYLENPVVIDAALRSKLDAFKNRELNKAWAWFVQATRKITESDFKVLTGGLK
ncbi:MAG: EVE domain-containing protein [Methanophagales archaeon]|nr:EVE domain-containing protein [Methanophagales archaeon]